MLNVTLSVHYFYIKNYLKKINSKKNLFYNFCYFFHEISLSSVTCHNLPNTLYNPIQSLLPEYKVVYVYMHTHIYCRVYVYIYKYTRRLPHYLIYHSPLSCPERHINLSRYYMCLFGRLILHKCTLLHIKVYLMKLFLCIALNSKLEKVYGSHRARIFSFLFLLFLYKLVLKISAIFLA